MIKRTRTGETFSLPPYDDQSEDPRPLYSFSRIKNYEQCRYQYYLTYLLPEDKRPPREENSFALYGGFCHSILERYANGELMPHEMLEEYEDQFDIQVNMDFPPNAFADLRSSYYNDGYSYFEFFDGFGDYEIVAAEKEFVTDINGFLFHGFIDLILKDKNGNYIVLDHKSKAKFKSKKEQSEYARQLMLYAKYIYDTYNVWPVKLIFNQFRKGIVVEIPFTKSAYDEAVAWAQTQIKQIESCDDWEPSADVFYCHFLCDYRNSCQFKPTVEGDI